MKKLEDKIERKLYDLICSSGGNGETITRFAKSIAKIAREHITKELQS